MIQIINYGAGNIKSVENALKQLGIKSKIVSSGKTLRTDCKTIFPGVGSAKTAMQEIKKRGFEDKIKQIKAPFLGICLGMQLLMNFSEENNTKCLKIIKGYVKKFPKIVKIPQIGWNKVEQINFDNPLFQDIPNKSYFYFVNSYFIEISSIKEIKKSPYYTITDYGIKFVSAINENNFYGVQFHPEKSSEIGLQLLNNFYKLC